MNYYWVLKGSCLYKTFVVSSGCNSETCPVAWGYNHYRLQLQFQLESSLQYTEEEEYVAQNGEGLGTLDHHMNDVRWGWGGGRGWCPTSYTQHLRSYLAVECLMRKSSVLLNVDPTSPTSTLRHLMSFMWWVFPDLSIFRHCSTSIYYCEHKQKNKNKAGLGMRLRKNSEGVGS